MGKESGRLTILSYKLRQLLSTRSIIYSKAVIMRGSDLTKKMWGWKTSELINDQIEGKLVGSATCSLDPTE